jgi:hypothetical protein
VKLFAFSLLFLFRLLFGGITWFGSVTPGILNSIYTGISLLQLDRLSPTSSGIDWLIVSLFPRCVSRPPYGLRCYVHTVYMDRATQQLCINAVFRSIYVVSVSTSFESLDS